MSEIVMTTEAEVEDFLLLSETVSLSESAFPVADR